MSLHWRLESQREDIFEGFLEEMLKIYNDLDRAEKEAKALTEKAIEEME
jgi:molecular chaperone GrpE (heat shock protein)|tara:strand:+ start:273 stop:419 length:147 start_codon:yes stop_codon:yes gene_type:complete